MWKIVIGNPDGDPSRDTPLANMLDGHIQNRGYQEARAHYDQIDLRAAERRAIANMLSAIIEALPPALAETVVKRALDDPNAAVKFI